MSMNPSEATEISADRKWAELLEPDVARLGELDRYVEDKRRMREWGARNELANMPVEELEVALALDYM